MKIVRDFQGEKTADLVMMIYEKAISVGLIAGTMKQVMGAVKPNLVPMPDELSYETVTDAIHWVDDFGRVLAAYAATMLDDKIRWAGHTLRERVGKALDTEDLGELRGVLLRYDSVMVDLVRGAWVEASRTIAGDTRWPEPIGEIADEIIQFDTERAGLRK